MTEQLIILIVGLAVGASLTLLTVWFTMPKMMLHEVRSGLSFDDTVAGIEQAAIKAGWEVPKVYDLQASLSKAGKTDVSRMKVISMCQPDHADTILAEEKNRRVTAMMPCRIGVYEGDDGQVLMTQMNIGLMSRMFGGTIERVMRQVAAEEKTILARFVEP